MFANDAEKRIALTRVLAHHIGDLEDALGGVPEMEDVWARLQKRLIESLTDWSQKQVTDLVDAMHDQFTAE